MAQPPPGKRFLCLLATLLLFFTLFRQVSADGGGTPFEQETNGYHANLVFEETAKVGSNNIIVKLRTESGTPIDGATVEIEVGQSSGHDEVESSGANSHESTTKDMGNDSSKEITNPETQADEHDQSDMITLEAGHEPGEYHGSITLPRAGEWEVNVHFTHQGMENMVSFPLKIDSDFLKTGILGGFLTVNIAVMATAAVQKRKTAAAKTAALKAAVANKTAVVSTDGASIERND